MVLETIGVISIILVIIIAVSYYEKALNKRELKINVSTADFSLLKPIPLSRLSDLEIDDMSVLEDYLYDLFYKFEEALNNLDYNTMSILTTSKLYNLYHTDINLNNKKGIRRVIKDVNKKKILVYDLYKSDERQMLYAFIEIEYVTYFVSKDGKIIRGSEKPIKERFDVTYTKKYSSKDVIKCPNCGNSVLGSTCSYCRTNLRNQDFKIDSIKRNIHGEE